MPSKFRFLRFIFIFWIFCFSIPALSPKVLADDLSEISIQTHKYTLENGLTVLISEIPSSSVVSVYGLVKTGSATEGKFLGAGLSHFMEHMLFKGTEKRGVGEISHEIQAMGGEVNASTSFDFTIFTITVPGAKFDQGLDILSDMLMHSKFDPDQINKEREVVYGEMRLYKDRPGNYLSDMVRQVAYTQHPYKIPIIGYEELLRKLNNQSFVEYYKERYIPDNMIISVAGNVDAEATLAKVKEAFKDFKRQYLVLRNLMPEPPQVSSRRYEEEYKTDLTRATMAYQGVSLLHPDTVPLDVLAMVLGQGESSRLYRELFKKQKLVQTVSASNFTPKDNGLFEIDFIPAESDVDGVVAAVKQQIKLIQDNGINPAELEKVKRQAISSYINDQQTSSDVAYNTAMDEAIAGDYEFSKKYVAAVGQITSDDIKRVANQYLRDDHLSLVILRPIQKKEEAAQKAVAKAELPIEKIKLDNGLTILLRENPGLPIVSVSLALNGGVSQEPVNGLSELTARTWTQGTKSKSADTIAEMVDSHGASLDGFSGRNSFGLQMSLLSTDLNWGLDLLEDVVKNPSFDENEFAKEKDQVRTTLHGKQDDISWTTYQNLRETLFKTHPFRLEPLGSLDSIEHITAKDARNFYEQYLSPSNMVLTVFGKFDKEQVLQTLKTKFSSLKDKKVSIKTFEESPPAKIQEKAVTMDKKQAMVAIGFQAPGFYSADRYKIEVMTSILGSAFSGRIFNRIRDEFGEAYTLGGAYTPGRDMGVITFFVLTTPESVAKVKDLLEKIIAELSQEPVSDQELSEIKTYLKGSFAMDIETNAQLSFISGLDELYGLGYNHYQSYPAKIDEVTKDDIQRLARTYLDLNKAAVVVTQANPKP